jgi:hypothetical protein
MLHGILIRRYIIISSILSFLPIITNAQFSHRFEFLIEKTYSTQTDNISSSKDYISYYENTDRIGDGTIIGLKYNLNDLPISLFLGYENYKFSDYSINSNISVSDFSQELIIKSADLNIQYLFFNKSTFKPTVFVGLNYNGINYSRTGISYFYAGTSNGEYIHIDSIAWGYDLVQTDIKAIGVNVGTGLNIRLSDKIGVNGNIKFRYIPQNQTNWLDNHILIKTYSIGVYYRLLKRKNKI